MPNIRRPRTRSTSTQRLATIALAALAAGAVVAQQSFAAFSDTTDNGPSSLAAGTVDLSDDDSGSVLFNVSAMEPGDAQQKCIVVTYGGSLPSSLKLYGSVGGTGLASYLDLDVETGSGGSFSSCTGFTASPGTPVFDNTLASFASTHSAWSNGLAHGSNVTSGTSLTYRFTLTLQDDNAAQGKTATPTFTWEAQNT